MKKCPKCGHQNPDDYDYCIQDGTDIRAVPIVPPYYTSQSAASAQAVASGGTWRFKLLEENLTAAHKETEVRAYHCTSFKSLLLSLNAEGYLVVTNKRVVFHAFGSSFAGKSILQSEVPIEDVSGISIYKGSYFSFTHLLGAFFASMFVGSLVNGILGASVLSLVRLALQNQSPSDFQSLQNSASSVQTALQIFLWILGFGSIMGSFFFSKQNILRSIFAAMSALALIELGGVSYVAGALGSLAGGGQRGGGSSLTLVLGVSVGIYALVCFFWFARRPTMSLAVGSKGGASTPIAISGISSFGIYNTAASKALSAEPAEDSEALVRELGAMVMDIQALGDLGIEQWRKA